MAEQFGLDLVTYEGGTHVVARSADRKYEWLNDFFNEFNYSDQVVDLYAQVDAAFKEAGGGLQVNFLDVVDASKYGSWGHLRSLVDQNVRFDYLQETISDTNLDGRTSETFEQGVFRFGTSGDDTLVGTHSEDSLIAGAGNDTIIAGFGADNINGGDGVDRLVLNGSLSDYTVERIEGVLYITGPDGTTKSVVDVEEIEFAGTSDLVRTDIW